jgi:hypothetical protein
VPKRDSETHEKGSTPSYRQVPLATMTPPTTMARMARVLAAWVACVVAAGGSNHSLPETTVRCMESPSRSAECAAPLACREKPTCTSRIFTRTWAYANLFLDSSGDAAGDHPGRWLAFSTDPSFAPARVRTQPAVSHVIDATAFVDQKVGAAPPRTLTRAFPPPASATSRCSRRCRRAF